MSVLEEADKKLGLLDTVLTKTEQIFKKHWLIIIGIGIGGFVYWAFTLPPVETQDSLVPYQDSAVYREEDTTYYE